MLQHVRSLLEMIRFSHTIFALPFAILSALLAWQGPGRADYWPIQLLGILLCMVFARSAAMAFNRLADQAIDAANPRTAQRHLPSGKLSIVTVLIFTIVCALAFVASTALFLIAHNPWPLILALPVLGVIGAYSYTKRFTALAHFWLGFSLLLAPVAAWIAIRGIEWSPAPWVLGLAVLFWVAGFDIIYACQDEAFDREHKLYSVPSLLGVVAALRVAMICHAVMVLLLVALYWAAAPALGIIYLVGVAAVAGLLIYEHSLVRPDDLSRVNQAFFQVNAIISFGLLLIVVVQLFVPI